MKLYLTILLTIACSTIHAQSLEISLKNGDTREIEGKAQLEGIIKTYGLQINKWLFTKKVVIDKNTIPFSHPTLTLNCNYLKDDPKQLANFLHEQFHWFVEDRSAQEKNAIQEFKQIFPDVPAGGKEGARDEYSSYLHLIVCDLEFQAMTKVLGEAQARQLLSSWSHYTWIYDKILNDKRIREITTKNGFVIP